ncbi:hypothetical protein F5B18DRAFT_618279 [Nemania serpens]|nr:hypothetical protein F5B18DRAFT_618279 [Nemania serpens]
MGRTEPTVVKPPAAFRRDARAKRARATLNKVIPALLSAHPRARRGIERSELIVDPPGLHQRGTQREEGGKGSKHASLDGDRKGASSAKRDGRRKRERRSDEQPQFGDEKKNTRRERDERKHDASTKSESHSLLAPGANGPRITLRIADTLTAAQWLLDPGPSSSSSSSYQQQQRQRKRRGSKEDSTYATPDSVAVGTKVGILNMASPLSPGGGFLNGATSQEESLCMRTTLLPALRDEFYRLPELGVVHTPDVLVFRSADATSPSSSSFASRTETGAHGSGSGSAISGTGDDEKDVLPKNDRWFLDVASAAMLRLPETEDGRYANAADRELAERKMRAVLRVFCAGGCSRVVLGAWGCGAYGNPVAEIAEAWRRVLCPRSEGEDRDRANNDAAFDRDEGKGGRRKKGGREKKSRTRDREAWGACIDEIVFAIKDAGMAASFARAFGEDILPLPTSRSGDGERGSVSSTTGDGDEDPAEVARVSEIWGKIAQLEIQVAQVRSPHLKLGLETVLAGLRRQLPPEDGEEEAASGVEPGYTSKLDEEEGGHDDYSDDEDEDDEGYCIESKKHTE